MVKEDRSGWVAVAPEFASSREPEIVPAKSAYHYFQKDVSDEVKAELAGQKFDVGQFSRRMRDRWNLLEDKTVYEKLGQQDKMRFSQESHRADVASMERQRKLQEEREQVVIYEHTVDGKKSTRRALKKQQRKQEKQDRKQSSAVGKKEVEWKSDMEDDDEDDYSEDDSDDSDAPKKKKVVAPRQISAATAAKRDKAKNEKLDKERYITARQDDLRKDRAKQAKRRLEFLLKQSDIFSHFGNVKEESALYGVNVKSATTPNAKKDGALRGDNEAADEADLVEQEEKTTYLTAQPTSLSFGKMRAYQLEGLNWMIRLQENGVNGIL
jgi:SWI/SNF-related matrix-associated actin-dependent regulator of chromatin subfamily A member 5